MVTRQGKRAYRSTLRGRHAEQTRESILTAARTLLREHGYEGMTVRAVAQSAGVAEQTVFAAVGPKTAIVAELIASVAASVDSQDLITALTATSDPAARLALVARLTRRIYDTLRDELALFDGAAVLSPELAEAHHERGQERRNRQSWLVDELATAGALPTRLTRRHALDVLWALTGSALYTMLVVEQGWPSDRYEAWLTEQLTFALLADDGTQQGCNPSP